MSDQPGWTPPDPNGASAPPPPPPPYGAPPPQYGAPPPQYGQPQYGQPQYAEPQYSQPAGWFGYQPKPGVVPLRPLGVGEILDGALSTVRSNWKVLLGSAALIVGAYALLDFILQLTLLSDTSFATRTYDFNGNERIDFNGGGFAALVPLLLVEFLAVLAVTAICAAVTSRAVLGERPTWQQTWERVRPQLGRLIGVGLLTALALTAGALVCGIGIVYPWVIFSLAVPALVLERTGVTRALGRSNGLVRGAWWRTFWLLLLGYLLTEVITFAISLPVLFLGGAFNGIFSGTYTNGQDVGLVALSALAGFLVGIVTWPFLGCLVTVMYVDRRMRTEGLDLELQRAVGVPTTYPPQTYPPQPYPPQAYPPPTYPPPGP